MAGHLEAIEAKMTAWRVLFNSLPDTAPERVRLAVLICGAERVRLRAIELLRS